MRTTERRYLVNVPQLQYLLKGFLDTEGFYCHRRVVLFFKELGRCPFDIYFEMMTMAVLFALFFECEEGPKVLYNISPTVGVTEIRPLILKIINSNSTSTCKNV
jgi:hypothetical protein